MRHYGFLSRRSKVDLSTVRATILRSLENIDPDLELETWSIPILRPAADTGPTCPACGGPLVFERFHRIRPPPLQWRRREFVNDATRFEHVQD